MSAKSQSRCLTVQVEKRRERFSYASSLLIPPSSPPPHHHHHHPIFGGMRNMSSGETEAVREKEERKKTATLWRRERERAASGHRVLLALGTDFYRVFFFFAWLARTELATAFWWFCRDGNCLCVCVCTCVCVWRWVLAGRTRRSEDSVVRLYWVNPGSERNRNEQPRGTAVGNVSHFQ